MNNSRTTYPRRDIMRYDVTLFFRVDADDMEDAKEQANEAMRRLKPKDGYYEADFEITTP
jgi:hypothetical protein